MTFPFSLSLWSAPSRRDGVERGGRTAARARTSPEVEPRPATSTVEHVPEHRRVRAEQECAWVRALRAGDLAAFEAIYHAYFPLLWRLAARSVGDGSAEDLAHDVFVALWERRATATYDDHLGPYLVAALRGRLRERFRHEQVVHAAHDRMDPELPPGSGEMGLTPDDESILNELEAGIAAALRQLPARQREALMLRWYHRMSYDEIARALGLSVVAARQLVSRTQRLVRPLLDRFR